MNAKLVLGVGAIAAMAVLAASDANATSVSGFAGQPQAPADYGCFSNFFGAVRNDCAGSARRYCVALPATNSTHTVHVNVLAPDSSRTVQCEAFSVNQSLTVVNSTGPQTSTVFGAPQTMLLGTIAVSHGGGLFVCCNISQTARLQTINY